MNPLLAAVVNTAAHSKRQCLKCGMTQIVPKEKSNRIVVCKSCGADIPPPDKQDMRGSD